MKNALRKIALAAGGFAFFTIGARITLPGINVQALIDANRNGKGLVGLYNLLAGGATARGAVLAVGILPYLTAKILMTLIRAVSPKAQALRESPEGRGRWTQWTAALTIALAAVQGLGFASYLQSIPGVVEQPGIGFTLKTILMLTAGSVVAMAVTEKLMESEAEGELPDRELRQRDLQERELQDRELPGRSLQERALPERELPERGLQRREKER